MKLYFLVLIVDNISKKYRTFAICHHSPIFWYACHVQNGANPLDTALIGYTPITEEDYNLYIEHVENVIDATAKK